MLHPKSSFLEACPKWCVSSEETETNSRRRRLEGGRREGKAQTASRMGPGAGRVMGAQRALSAIHYSVLKSQLHLGLELMVFKLRITHLVSGLNEAQDLDFLEWRHHSERQSDE